MNAGEGLIKTHQIVSPTRQLDNELPCSIKSICLKQERATDWQVPSLSLVHLGKRKKEALVEQAAQ